MRLTAAQGQAGAHVPQVQPRREEAQPVDEEGDPEQPRVARVPPLRLDVRKVLRGREARRLCCASRARGLNTNEAAREAAEGRRAFATKIGTRKRLVISQQPAKDVHQHRRAKKKAAPKQVTLKTWWNMSCQSSKPLSVWSCPIAATRLDAMYTAINVSVAEEVCRARVVALPWSSHVAT